MRICRKMTKTRFRYGKSDKNVFEYTQTEHDFLNYVCLCGIIFLLIIKGLLCKEVSSIVKMEDTSRTESGVDKMALQLFAHNAKAYAAAVDMMQKYGKAAVIHPTGTGKSYIAFKLIEDHPDAPILWLSPSEYIFKTQRENLLKQNPDFRLQNVRFYTYAKLMCCTEEQLAQAAAMRPAYIILDEFHRVGAEYWGAGTKRLLALCPQAKLLGLTATGVRYLDNNRDMAAELFDGHVASEMTLGEAIVRGILPAPKYVTTVFRYRQDLARYESRVDNLRSPGIRDVNRDYLEALKRALEQSEGLNRVFARHIMDRTGKYIVFCSGKEHMEEMIAHVPEWFAEVDAAPKIYKALSEDPSTDKAFAAFKADESPHLKLLFCIDMLNEGVHVEGISGVILFRPTVSPIVYKQQIGRALTAGEHSTPLILDIVNNFEGLSSISGLQNEMKAAVRRLYANGEGDKVVTERFEIVEQVRDCRVLFEQLQRSLSSTWDHYFAEASIYYAEHGNLDIPKEYKTPTGLSLGSWLQIQRLVRSGKRPGTLTPQQIERLDGIGMCWESRSEQAWNRGLAKAAAYAAKHGNLLVPGKWTDEDGFPLGNWIANRRIDKISGRLDAEQIQELEKLGMAWDAFSEKWEQGYAAAAQYYADHGNLLVPSTYETKNGLRLGTWIRNQKQAYNSGRLPQNKIARLDAISMCWGDVNALQWNTAYEAAKRYFEENGNLNVPTNYVTEDGTALGKWVIRQQYARRNPTKSNVKLTPERIARLDEIGMQWEKPDPWQHRYDLADAYLQSHGNLKIPAKYKTSDGIWLGRWLYEQKNLLNEQSPKLNKEQTGKLRMLLGEHAGRDCDEGA